jgi:neopullulanase
MGRTCTLLVARCVTAVAFITTLCCGSYAQRSNPSPLTPIITKVDPPNWWIDLPSPMLLLRGEHFETARFSVERGPVTIQRTQVSSNGHWAFLWLNVHTHNPLMLHIRASNAAGSASYEFLLRRRRPATEGFQGFSSRDVMYLIMTDRFANGDTSNDAPANDPNPVDRSKPRGWHGGDFRGIEQHLDYLQQLGVTTIWTTPVYDNNPSPEAYHGYSATDMYGVDPHFGTLADYRHLVTALHAHGMKAVLDTVPNHVGSMHPWALDPPTPDWFHGTVAHHSTAQGNFIAVVDPHSAMLNRRDVTNGWFANVLPDLNQENPLVEKYLIQNAVWWVETAGLDGLRLDTFPYVGRGFWRDFHAQLHSLYPHLTTVGEIFNPDPTVTSYFAGSREHDGIDTGLDTPFDFPTYFTLRDVFIRDASMHRLEHTLAEDWLYPHPERLVPFLGNHDTTRFLSEPHATTAELKLAVGVLATLRGMPELYYGDEIAMQGGEDPDNRHDFPGGFPGDTANAFVSSGRMPVQQELFEWTSALLTFRAKHPALQTGQLQTIYADDTAIAYLRTTSSQGCDATNPGERYVIVINNAETTRQFGLQTEATALAGCTQWSVALFAPAPPRMEGSRAVFTLSGKQMAIYRATGGAQPKTDVSVGTK